MSNVPDHGTLRATAPRCGACLTRFRSDVRGIAAVEFAIILPLMLTMFFGMIDVSTGFAVDRKVTMVSQMISDLTSRYTAVQETDVTNFFNIADAMVTPYDKVPLQATISQIYIDPATKTGKVVWSRGDNKLVKGTVVSVPTDLVAKDASGNVVANQYLILGEAKYLYTPTIGWVVAKAGVTLSESSFTKPRQGTCVMMATTCTPTAG
jgi:Flp pilus assembly protein TadG